MGRRGGECAGALMRARGGEEATVGVPVTYQGKYPR
jgi:hypothetical protein